MFQRMADWWRRLVARPAEKEHTAELERRVWVRYPCSLETTLQPANSGQALRVNARVQNISRGGVSLNCEQHFEAGELLSVELPSQNEQWTTVVLAYIVRADSLPEGRWEYGCTFASELNEEDLTPFGALRQKADNRDQRTWVRFPCKINASYHRLKEEKTTLKPAKVLDISASGIGLVVTEAMDVGTLLSLHITSLNGGASLPILISVVRVTSHQEQEWLLGCNFLRELSDRELIPFLKTE